MAPSAPIAKALHLAASSVGHLDSVALEAKALTDSLSLLSSQAEAAVKRVRELDGLRGRVQAVRVGRGEGGGGVCWGVGFTVGAQASHQCGAAAGLPLPLRPSRSCSPPPPHPTSPHPQALERTEDILDLRSCLTGVTSAMERGDTLSARSSA